ncbi:tripartite tricarboxylate transporter permease [Telmatospirillum sp. J64-1]|uniref:tripartite tricarboxylate transporter permease n=1 Tax=Telmatospirillum sp. J64-1 TaxID=2502183 RepID=UPI00210624EA|nr:tripartite tricarboxylate transporter permease [Telmatospirillum sp. J64-1]
MASSSNAWLLIIPGLLIGLIFGCIPGLQTSLAMALVLPATMTMDLMSAIFLLTAVFTGSMFGGGISAILMNIPGTSSAVATAFDGYPMTRRGEHGEALGLALAASAIGTMLGYLVLLIVIAPLAGFVLKLGPTEMFIVVLWGLTLIAGLDSGSVARGILAGAFGLLIGTVGMSSNGVIRGTLGVPELLDGIAIVPAMIGMFAASELFSLKGNSYIVAEGSARRVSIGSIAKGALQVLRYPGVILRGGLLGVLVGAVPGVGSSISNLVSYKWEKGRKAVPGERKFGEGNPRGLVASESANSSSEGGSMVSLFALGIPGGAGTAILLAAFNMHNITGGPRFLRDHGDIVYAVIAANIVQAIALFFVGFLALQLLGAVVRLRMSWIRPSVLILAALGSYGIIGTMQGPLTLLAFALLGWLMKRYGYSVPAMVIGLLLARMAEGELLRSYQISGGNFSYVLDRPITLVMAALLLLSLMVPFLRKRLTASKAAA